MCVISSDRAALSSGTAILQHRYRSGNPVERGNGEDDVCGTYSGLGQVSVKLSAVWPRLLRRFYQHGNDSITFNEAPGGVLVYTQTASVYWMEISVYWDGTLGKLIIYSSTYLECASLYTCCHSIREHRGHRLLCPMSTKSLFWLPKQPASPNWWRPMVSSYL